MFKGQKAKQILCHPKSFFYDKIVCICDDIKLKIMTMFDDKQEMKNSQKKKLCITFLFFWKQFWFVLQSDS